MKEKIIEIMSEVFELPINDFPVDIKQENVDNWDSLRHLNLIVELEDAFDKSFEPEDIGEMVSLDKIIEFIEK
ncbi:acyl carrier protein [Flavobacterium plurextorum]|uniref:Acyl carrier protein n=1 Tax=Flavobacterium plurextorum TaxID=1114867 RepID=A0ABX4CPM8_9FLAO|nr:acyl carrier protein [Flavobacterium plurextorum]OXB00996.1 acyl carrier protein [Flavobacterium plurextorum]